MICGGVRVLSQVRDRPPSCLPCADFKLSLSRDIFKRQGRPVRARRGRVMPRRVDTLRSYSFATIISDHLLLLCSQGGSAGRLWLGQPRSDREVEIYMLFSNVISILYYSAQIIQTSYFQLLANTKNVRIKKIYRNLHFSIWGRRQIRSGSDVDVEVETMNNN